MNSQKGFKDSMAKMYLRLRGELPGEHPIEDVLNELFKEEMAAQRVVSEFVSFIEEGNDPWGDGQACGLVLREKSMIVATHVCAYMRDEGLHAAVVFASDPLFGDTPDVAWGIEVERPTVKALASSLDGGLKKRPRFG